MKRTLFLAVVLLVSCVAYAQKNGYTVHNVEVMGSIGWTKADYIKSGKIYTGSASYAYSLNRYFGLGGGLSYGVTDVIFYPAGGHAEESKWNMYSIYGTVRGYLPTYSKHISFVGVVDAGATYLDLVENLRYEDLLPSWAFMCSPQFGIRIKLMKDKSPALNVRLYYKHYSLFDDYHSFDEKGILFGISF